MVMEIGIYTFTASMDSLTWLFVSSRNVKIHIIIYITLQLTRNEYKSIVQINREKNSHENFPKIHQRPSSREEDVFRNISN